MPATFGEYKRGSLLGRGASGIVFECTHVSKALSFAAKAVDLRRLRVAGGPGVERQLKKLHREVDILRRLPPHPHLVHFEAAFVEGSWLFFVMELLPLGDLMGALLARGDDQPSAGESRPRFHEAEGRDVALQLAEGLRFLHGEGVIHRDLKPENVLVASERREAPYTFVNVKITDFGLSKVVGEGYSEARSTVGTPIYVAPEVMTNGLVHGFAADRWSLGIVLFVLLDGRFPYEGSPAQKQDVLDRRVQQLEVSGEARTVICGLLRLDPERRMTLEEVRTHTWFSLQIKPPLSANTQAQFRSLQTEDLFGSDLISSSRVEPTPSLKTPQKPSASRDDEVLASRASRDDAQALAVAAGTSPADDGALADPIESFKSSVKRTRTDSQLDEESVGSEREAPTIGIAQLTMAHATMDVAQGDHRTYEQSNAAPEAMEIAQGDAAFGNSAEQPNNKRLRRKTSTCEVDASNAAEGTGDARSTTANSVVQPIVAARGIDGAIVTAVSPGSKAITACHVSGSPDARLSQKTPGDVAQGPLCQCGGAMRIRQRKNDAAQFWGCSRFPVCQKTNDLSVVCSCGKEMVKRSKRSTGEAFFGCSAYPSCKRTMNVQEIPPYCEVCSMPMVRRCKKDDIAAAFWGCPRFPMCRRTRMIGA